MAVTIVLHGFRFRQGCFGAVRRDFTHSMSFADAIQQVPDSRNVKWTMLTMPDGFYGVKLAYIDASGRETVALPGLWAIGG